MSSHIPANLVQAVFQRADRLCEYCRLPQATQEATFHVDHVRPRSQDGPTTLDNLALACVTCSLKKAARTHAVNPETGEPVRLFNPRTDSWPEHFHFSRSGEILGATPVARATIDLLGMNRSTIILIRQELATLGRFPP